MLPCCASADTLAHGRFRLAIAALAMMLSPEITLAQSAARAPSIVVRELTIGDRSPHVFANIFQVRQIANGRILVNDGLRRQLMLFDDKLVFARVVLDSVAAEGGERYGPGAAPMIPALGDSSWFVDRQAKALLVIDPTGKVVRTTAAPSDPMHLLSIATSRSGVDANGHLIFRVFSPPIPKRVGDTTLKKIVREMRPPVTAPIMRANFDARTTDTIGAVKQVTAVRSMTVIDPPSTPVSTMFMHPLETIDDWAVLADGTIALVRGSDYHVDFMRPDGKKESGPKLAFDWKTISDTEKQRILDSTRTVIDSMVARVNAQSGVSAANTALAMLVEGMIINTGGTPPTPPPPPARAASPGERSTPPLRVEMVPASEMPDYYPPIRQGAVLADRDGGLWILPNTSAQSKAGELVYDVVDGKGALTERVRLPLGRSVVGFGRGGVVYLMSKDAEGWHLESARVRK